LRFLFACGVAILIVATAKTVDVLQTPFGAAVQPPLWLPFAINGFVLYGVGLAMLFFNLAAHIALPAVSPRLAKARVALGLVAIAAGAVIAAYVPFALATGVASIFPEERTRFLVVVAISNLHLFANGLLLIALGVRVLRVTRPAAA
jgi:hypothetical protein